MVGFSAEAIDAALGQALVIASPSLQLGPLLPPHHSLVNVALWPPAPGREALGDGPGVLPPSRAPRRSARRARRRRPSPSRRSGACGPRHDCDLAQPLALVRRELRRASRARAPRAPWSARARRTPPLGRRLGQVAQRRRRPVRAPRRAPPSPACRTPSRWPRAARSRRAAGTRRSGSARRPRGRSPRAPRAPRSLPGWARPAPRPRSPPRRPARPDRSRPASPRPSRARRARPPRACCDDALHVGVRRVRVEPLERLAPRCPRCVEQRRASAACPRRRTRSHARSVSIARSVRSPRLPIGVATTKSVPATHAPLTPQSRCDRVAHLVRAGSRAAGPVSRCSSCRTRSREMPNRSPSSWSVSGSSATRRSSKIASSLSLPSSVLRNSPSFSLSSAWSSPSAMSASGPSTALGIMSTFAIDRPSASPTGASSDFSLAWRRTSISATSLSGTLSCLAISAFGRVDAHRDGARRASFAG